MKNSYKHLIFIGLLFLVSSCSEESQIEGLIATKPTVVEINTEVTAGTSKTVPVSINNTAINLQVNYSLTTSGTTQTRFCMVNFLNNVGYMPFITSSSFISKAEADTELSQSIFNNASFNGYLVYTTNAINNTTYNYVNTNGIKYGSSYFIPVKFVLNGNVGTAQFAYMTVTIAADKVTINRIVYNKVGGLKVGEE